MRYCRIWRSPASRMWSLVASATSLRRESALSGAISSELRTAAWFRDRLSGQEWRSIIGMAAFILGLHIVGWGVLIAIVVPHHYQIASGQILGIGLGLTAYTLGMRHAFDADHIAAIDNTTRKLMSEGKRPVLVGFWFSLGH